MNFLLMIKTRDILVQSVTARSDSRLISSMSISAEQVLHCSLPTVSLIRHPGSWSSTHLWFGSYRSRWHLPSTDIDSVSLLIPTVRPIVLNVYSSSHVRCIVTPDHDLFSLGPCRHHRPSAPQYRTSHISVSQRPRPPSKPQWLFQVQRKVPCARLQTTVPFLAVHAA